VELTGSRFGPDPGLAEPGWADPGLIRALSVLLLRPVGTHRW